MNWLMWLEMLGGIVLFISGIFLEYNPDVPIDIPVIFGFIGGLMFANTFTYKEVKKKNGRDK